MIVRTATFLFHWHCKPRTLTVWLVIVPSQAEETRANATPNGGVAEDLLCAHSCLTDLSHYAMLAPIVCLRVATLDAHVTHS